MLLAVVRPMHQRAHEGRDADVGARQEQYPQHAADGKRHRGQDDQRIDPALKIDDKDQVDQDHSHGHAGKQPIEALAHGFHLACKRHMGRFCFRWSIGRQNLIDGCRSRCEIDSLNIGIDVEHRADVELRCYERDLRASKPRSIHKYLALLAAAPR